MFLRIHSEPRIKFNPINTPGTAPSQALLFPGNNFLQDNTPRAQSTVDERAGNTILLVKHLDFTGFYKGTKKFKIIYTNS